MIARDALRAIVDRYFPDAPGTNRVEAVEAIVEAGGEWEDVTGRADLDQRFASECAEVTYLADQVQRGADLRILRRRVP